eukprot:CAMPEP_0179151718 /NCGR_PEP_ID=MMETSP0796-20121207/73678_1 /TAXON_ID=73915 /ORGANISM="Pyrodinium bahamense, Strain pbaha01" /LENGTH=72 /DNA_ID=CAMNT_0020852845 /DNA_START=76 /DNA_END=291 /DNA_ORIENTATION=+
MAFPTTTTAGLAAGAGEGWGATGTVTWMIWPGMEPSGMVHRMGPEGPGISMVWPGWAPWGIWTGTSVVAGVE